MKADEENPPGKPAPSPIPLNKTEGDHSRLLDLDPGDVFDQDFAPEEEKIEKSDFGTDNDAANKGGPQASSSIRVSSLEDPPSNQSAPKSQRRHSHARGGSSRLKEGLQPLEFLQAVEAISLCTSCKSYGPTST